MFLEVVDTKVALVGCHEKSLLVLLESHRFLLLSLEGHQRILRASVALDSSNGLEEGNTIFRSLLEAFKEGARAGISGAAALRFHCHDSKDLHADSLDDLLPVEHLGDIFVPGLGRNRQNGVVLVGTISIVVFIVLVVSRCTRNQGPLAVAALVAVGNLGIALAILQGKVRQDSGVSRGVA